MSNIDDIFKKYRTSENARLLSEIEKNSCGQEC